MMFLHKKKSDSTHHTSGSNDKNPKRANPLCNWFYLALFIVIITNVPMIIYFSLYHKAGSIAILSLLRQHLASTTTTPTNSNISVHFLMPCHSTPYYSHLHLQTSSPLEFRFLDCSPRFTKEGEIIGSGLNVYSQHRRFLKQPIHFIYHLYQPYHNLSVPASAESVIWGEENEREILEYASEDISKVDEREWKKRENEQAQLGFGWPSPWPIPHYIAIYDHLLPHLQPLLDYFHFVEVGRVFHSHMEEHYMVLYHKR